MDTICKGGRGMRFSKINQKIKNKTHSLHARKNASLCLLKAGSLTIEAAFVLPLFFLAMITFISFMNAIGMQVKESAATAQKAKELGMYAYITKGSLDGGGIINLGHKKSYKLPVKLFPIKAISFYVSGRVRAWTGYVKGSIEADQTGSEMVYVSDYESVYHKDALCTYLDVSVATLSKAGIEEKTNAYGSHYKPCEKCGNYHAGQVYVTEKGQAYHTDRNCSGLKRSRRLVELKDAAGLSVCSKCGGIHGK